MSVNVLQEAIEDPSVYEHWRGSLLVHATSDAFTVVWEWQEGDLAIW